MRNAKNNMKGCNMRDSIATANTNMNAMPSYMYPPSISAWHFPSISARQPLSFQLVEAQLVRVDGSKCKNSGDYGAP